MLAQCQCYQHSPCRQVQAHEMTPCTSNLACQYAACNAPFAVDKAQQSFTGLFYLSKRGCELRNANLHYHQDTSRFVAVTTVIARP